METIQTQQTQEIKNNNPTDYLIQARIIREKGDIKLYIKTCNQYEEYLKNTRTLKEIENFCNTNETKKVYTDKLETNAPDYDSVVRDLIIYNRLNNAVLRIKGISEGITINLNKLITKNDLNLMIRTFIKDFVTFYKEKLTEYEINILITQKNILI